MGSVKCVSTPIGPISFCEIAVKKQNIILMLDCSSSMMGLPIDNAKCAIDKLQNEIKVDHFLIFDHRCKQVSLSDLYRVQASGGTDFNNAFCSAAKLLCPGHNVIVLITDGETNKKDVDASMEALRRAKSDNATIQVHSIGIDADPTLLLLLAQIDIPGTVRCVDAFDLVPVVQNTFEEINEVKPLKLVPVTDATVTDVDISSMESSQVGEILTLLVQNISKTPSTIMAECERVQQLMDNLKLEDPVRVTIRDKLRHLRQLAADRISNREFDERIASICYAPRKAKFVDLLNRHILKPKISDISWIPYEMPPCMRELKCIITYANAQEIYDDGDMFGVGLFYEPRDVWVANPEIGKVEVQNVFLSWEGFKNAVFNTDGSRIGDGIIRGLDGVKVVGFFPLVPNKIGIHYLKSSAALYSTGRLHAVSYRATNVLPILAYMHVYMLPDSEWTRTMLGMIGSMCLAVLPDMRVRAKSLHWTPDTFPSLEVFLIQCILDDDIKIDEIMLPLFNEWARRHFKNQKIAPFKTVVRSDKVNVQDIIRNTLKSWNNSIPVERHDVKLNVECVLNNDAIQETLRELKSLWIPSELNKILTRYNTDRQRPTVDVISLVSDNILEFLNNITLTSCKVKMDGRAEIKPRYDKNTIIAQRLNIIDEWWAKFRELKSIDECAAVVYHLSEFEKSVFCKKLKLVENYAIPLYGIKLGLVYSGYMYRRINTDGLVEFMEIV